MTKNIKFEELALSQEVLKAVVDLGFVQASPIQAESIPFLLEGRDVIGQAMTGTGKTAAFGIPIVEKINTSDRNVQALIMCPTRELAIQVAVEISKLAKYKHGLNVLPIYGGQPIERQLRALRQGVHVVIGTPGRLMDHMERKSLSLKAVKTVVLDEADQMLDMGFRDDMEFILEHTDPDRQTVLFSATMSHEILQLAKRFQNKPHMVKIESQTATVPAVEQVYFEVEGKMKIELLSRLIDLHNPKSSIVFCNTKRRVDDVVSGLSARGFAVEGIHGDISQAKRDRVMAKFRKGGANILVATDVAARGIDVPHVEAVFNLEIPRDQESYVHRIGRTGRAGRSGKAFSFVSGREQYEFRAIKRFTKTDIEQQPIPLLERIENLKTNKMLVDIKKVVQEGALEKYTGIIQQLVEQDHAPVDIAAALLKIISHKNGQPKEDLLAKEHPYEEDRSYADRPRGGNRRRGGGFGGGASRGGGNWKPRGNGGGDRKRF